MKKHYCLSQWLLAILLALIPTISSAQEIGDRFLAVNSDGVILYYNITSSNTVAVGLFSSEGYSGVVNIPSNVINYGVSYAVTSISNDAFRGLSSLRLVTIPNTVTSIGNEAFIGCSSLTSVTIPNSVTSIGSSAFQGCSSLTSVTLGNSVTTIGNEAFRDCSSLTSVTIPNSVTAISNYAFSDCSSLTSITIPNSVKAIGNYAFRNCSNLEEVNIPSSVTNIGNRAFEGTALYNNNTNWIDGVLYIDNCLIKAKNDEIPGSYNIKKGTQTIADWAFSLCTSLTSVNVPNSVTSIGIDAFLYCIGLTSFTIPRSVTSIGAVAFDGCSNLTEIKVKNPNPHSISLGSYVFQAVPDTCTTLCVPIGSKNLYAAAYQWEDFRNIVEVEYESGQVPIGSTLEVQNSSGTPIYYKVTSDNEVSVTFKGNTYNSYSDEYSGDVTIPPSVTYDGISYSVTSIGVFAFRNCSSLTSVTIPNSVTSIGVFAFDSCSNLSSVNFPNSVTSIGYSAFSYCSSLTSVTIPNSVTSIGDHAFYSCSNLKAFYGKFASEDNRCLIVDGVLNSFAPAGLTSYVIPNTVTSIGNCAFWNCSNLTSVIIPNAATSIGEDAFYYCSGLTSVTIPNSVTEIGNNAFDGCSSLTSVIIGNSVTFIDVFAFSDCCNLKAFYGKFASEDNRCLIVDGVLNSFAPAGLTSYNIPNAATSIGKYAFYNCRNLTSVNIPNSVTAIGNGAFLNCRNLTSVNIPNSVTSIGNVAFHDTALYNSENNWIDGVLYINNCLIEAKSIEIVGSYNIKPSTRLIADWAFYSCTGLTSVNIPNLVTSIGNNTFYHCSNLKSVNIPNSVTSIGGYAFSGCSGMTEVIIPNSVTFIDEYAFYDCSSLTSVTIPTSVTSIGEVAFYGCSKLTEIKVENKNPANVKLGLWVFDNVPTSSCTLYVPKGSKELYAAADQWKDFKNIVEFEPEAEFVMGDLDGDEKVSIADVVIGCNLILSGEYNEAVDFNNDGKITIADIVLLCNEILSNKE